MKPIRIFRHIDCEGPGYLAEVLDRKGVPHELIAIDLDEPVPANLDDVSALVFMGGPMSVNDALPWIAEELALIRRAASLGLPLLGHCLGGQLISKALGADVRANPVQEIGWHSVRPVRSAGSEEWLKDLPASFEAYHWHGETFDLPAGAVPLLASRYCANQAYALGNVLAFQCHIEVTEAMVREWARRYAAEIAEPTESVQDAAAMTVDLERRAGILNRLADMLYERWLAGLSVV